MNILRKRESRMVNFKQEIAKEIAEVTNLDSKELENYIEIPPNSDLGDYAFMNSRKLNVHIRFLQQL